MKPFVPTVLACLLVGCAATDPPPQIAKDGCTVDLKKVCLYLVDQPGFSSRWPWCSKHPRQDVEQLADAARRREHSLSRQQCPTPVQVRHTGDSRAPCD